MPFLIAIIFGVGQVLLTERLFYAVNEKDFKQILKFLLIKIALYGFGITFAVTKGFWHLDVIISGFIIAAPVTAVGLFVYKIIKK